MPLRVLEVDHAEAAALYAAAYVLVRPDGSVAWRDDRLPEDPRAVLRVACGARSDSDVAPAGVVA
jgi:hypothetical protein